MLEEAGLTEGRKAAICSRTRKLETTRKRLAEGELVLYDQLPSYIRGNFFESRIGLNGYSFDVREAYRAYLIGVAKKTDDMQVARYLERIGVDSWGVRLRKALP
jgi:hypothetical protein